MVVNVTLPFSTRSILFGKIIEGTINKTHAYEHKKNVPIDFYLFPVQRTGKFHHKMLSNPNLVQ